MDEHNPNQDATVGDWKRRFQRETKVNKELGRRLRETKHQLQEEKFRSQELAAQLFEIKRHHCCKKQTTEQNGVCSNCEWLKEEVRRLKRVIADTALEPSKGVPLVTVTEDSYNEKNEVLPESDVDQNAADEAPPLAKAVQNLTTTLDKDISSLTNSATKPQCTAQPAPSLGRADDSNQMENDSPWQTHTEIDDSSLGALFKYAVVLAGPTPVKPQSKSILSFTDRFKASDVHRTRSLPEYEEPACEQHENHTAAEECASKPKVSSVGKWKNLSPGGGGSSWLSKRQPQSVQDSPNDDKVTTTLRRAATGLLSNLVPNGLRSTSSSAPSTPPQPPPAPAASNTPESPITSPASKLLCVFPPNAGEVQELEGLLEICFPYGEEPPISSDFSLAFLKRSLQERHRTYRSPDSTFVLTISSASNPTEITYAICVRCPLFPDKEDYFGDEVDPTTGKLGTPRALADGPTQCCLCLLSPYPFFGLFFKVLYGIAVLWNVKRKEALNSRPENISSEADHLTTMLEKPLGMLDFVEIFQDVMGRLKAMEVPPMGGWSRMVLSQKVTHLAFHRPHSASLAVERRHLLLEYAAPTLFGLLSVDQVLFLLGCLCCERKVLVVSDHVNIVSSCVLALITLLHPLQWAGPVITVLPPRLDELLEAPVPLIAGRVSINSASIKNFSTLERPMRDVIEMNMDQHALHMHDEDLVTYHELKLPECDELVHELEPFSAQLFGKHRDPDFPTVKQDEACKIMCARIHRHIESICLLAMAEKECGMVSGDASPRKRSDRAESETSSCSSSSRSSIAHFGRRSCPMIVEYILRFQETQMFSMFALQAQDAQNERDELDAEHDDSYSEYGEHEDEDNSDDVDEEAYGVDACRNFKSGNFKGRSAEPEAIGVNGVTY